MQWGMYWINLIQVYLYLNTTMIPVSLYPLKKQEDRRNKLGIVTKVYINPC